MDSTISEHKDPLVLALNSAAFKGIGNFGAAKVRGHPLNLMNGRSRGTVIVLDGTGLAEDTHVLVVRAEADDLEEAARRERLHEQLEGILGNLNTVAAGHAATAVNQEGKEMATAKAMLGKVLLLWLLAVDDLNVLRVHGCESGHEGELASDLSSLRLHLAVHVLRPLSVGQRWEQHVGSLVVEVQCAACFSAGDVVGVLAAVNGGVERSTQIRDLRVRGQFGAHAELVGGLGITKAVLLIVGVEGLWDVQVIGATDNIKLLNEL